MPAPLAKLDAWTIVERTSKAEASEAIGLDLRELALQDIDEIGVCTELKVALLSSNLFEQLSVRGFFQCSRLRKLDLSRNGLTALPDRDTWAKLRELVVLYLHDNELASLHSVGELATLPSLVRITLFENPLAKHPSYRHYCVNSLLALKALDLHVVSDEELIEGAVFPESLATKCPAGALPIFEPPPPQSMQKPPTDESLLRELRVELQALNHTHARVSPVLKLQSAARRLRPLRRFPVLLKEYRQAQAAKAAREAAHPPVAPADPATQAAPAPAPEAVAPPEGGEAAAASVGLRIDAAAAEEAAAKNAALQYARDRVAKDKAMRPEIDTEEAAELLGRKKAAVTVQAHYRSHSTRKLLSPELSPGAQNKRHEANQAHAPYLYVQTRHVHELEALLPGALGPEVSEQAYFEPTDCYTIRHSAEAPSDLSNPPLGGLLVRQRALHPPPSKLRLTPTDKEFRRLRSLNKTYSRPTKRELKALQAALEFADREQDGGVQQMYQRRQLVRLVLPDEKHFGAVLEAASRRNEQLLSAMGVADDPEARRSAKVLSELLVPISPPALDVVLATVTLQRVWRSISVRAKLQPSLVQRLLRARAATRMQRWWRWWLVKERFRMLSLVRERVMATTSNKLYLPTAVYEDLRGKSPLHAHELWPEHSSLKFTFAHNHEQNLQVSDSPRHPPTASPPLILRWPPLTHAAQYFVLPDALRPEMPNWAAPRMPIAQTRSLQQPQEPLSLLTVGVRMSGVPKAQLKGFVNREWTCVGFLSTLEASRRVAVLTAIAYEPLALRTVHGRLQVRFPCLPCTSRALHHGRLEACRHALPSCSPRSPLASSPPQPPLASPPVAGHLLRAAAALHVGGAREVGGGLRHPGRHARLPLAPRLLAHAQGGARAPRPRGQAACRRALGQLAPSPQGRARRRGDGATAAGAAAAGLGRLAHEPDARAARAHDRGAGAGARRLRAAADRLRAGRNRQSALRADGAGGAWAARDVGRLAHPHPGATER